MKLNPLPHILLGLCLCLTMTICGCDGDDSAGNVGGTSSTGGGSGSSGPSTISGQVTSFKTAKVDFVPVEQEKQGIIAMFASAVSEAILPSANAAGNRAGITVYIDGPVSQSTTTSDNGTFVFTGLPAGAYAFRFEYNGEEVTYRGNSGQVATITIGEGELLELSLKISGGKVNIGNIKFTKIKNDDNDDDPDDGDEDNGD